MKRDRFRTNDEFGLKNHREQKKKLNKKKMTFLVMLSLLTVCAGCNNTSEVSLPNHNVEQETSEQSDSDQTIEPSKEEDEQKKLEEEARLEEERLAKEQQERMELIEKADLLAKQYDYKAAKKLLKTYKDYASYDELSAKLEEYEQNEQTLVPYGALERADEISHVFFHSLIVDVNKAFDGDYMSNGYNYWMTTVTEFKAMLEQMYQNGYVLVSIHDVAALQKSEDGSMKMEYGEILLPKDKKPFVLSQDDTNYYEYMRQDGFARKIVIDENGYPACEYEENGEIKVGRDYDVVPILEKFIEEHPDFSYRGARGIIGVTGYEGVMGYRTNEKDGEHYKELVEQATKTADRLKELGWEFASHSYGHGHMGEQTNEQVKQDSEHWDADIASIVGKTDILLFPYGEDIEDTLKKYTTEKYTYLYDLGFRYFCGVCSYPWLQKQDEYIRMTRRNLDGFTMHFYPSRLDDLFSTSLVIDEHRPEFK